jgi:hypothetical protein
MGNIYTSISKTNDHHSAQTIKHTKHMTLQIHILAWDKHTIMAGLNLFMEFILFSGGCQNW